jgi:hypothetical protein
MDRDADDHLRVRTDVDGVGSVFRLRQPVYISPLPRSTPASSALKYEIAMRPSRVAALYVIPIFDDVAEWSKDDPTSRAQPFAALAIDRDEDFGDIVIDDKEQDNLVILAAIVGEEMRDRHVERGTEFAKSQAGLTGWDQNEKDSTLRLAARKIRHVHDSEMGVRLSQALLRLNTAATKPAS